MGWLSSIPPLTAANPGEFEHPGPWAVGSENSWLWQGFGFSLLVSHSVTNSHNFELERQSTKSLTLRV